MSKQQNTPIKLTPNTATQKIVGKDKKFYGVVTWGLVGPTCPTECWFHPVSDHRHEWPANFEPCYATQGHARFSTIPKAFEGATWDDAGIAVVRARVNALIDLHIAGANIIDIFRWHIGGDILHPETGQVWDAHVDLIVDTAARCNAAGIPLIGFTAAWRRPGAQRLKHLFLASVQSYAEARRAISMGWQVALAVTQDKYEEALAFLRSLDVKVIGCPEQRGKAGSCAECGWCTTVDPNKIHMHKYTTYMKYRKNLDTTGLPGSLILLIHGPKTKKAKKAKSVKKS